jgi:predicted metal-dependent hydrolase
MITARSTPIAIPVRMDIEFDVRDVPAVHTAENPCISHLWNALSMLAPTFEASAVKVLRHALKELDDPALRVDVEAFIRQEALHSRHHSVLNARLADQGADVAAFTSLSQKAWREVMAGRDSRRQLAVIVAGEQLIHALSVAGLSTPAVFERTHPEVRRLFTWHMVEEIEHQSVARDVYRFEYGHGLRDWAIHVAALWSAGRTLLQYATQIENALVAAGPQPTSDQRKEYRAYLWSTPGILTKVLLRAVRHALPWSKAWSDQRELELIKTSLERAS